MGEDQRLGKIITIKDALATIEGAILENDKLLSMTLENDMSANQEEIKNQTWQGCKAGLCPVDWVQRYPEKEFVQHMIDQDVLISKKDIMEKNLTIDDIKKILVDEDITIDPAGKHHLH